MFKHTQTIRREFANELSECFWPFCEIVKGLRYSCNLLQRQTYECLLVHWESNIVNLTKRNNNFVRMALSFSTLVSFLKPKQVEDTIIALWKAAVRSFTKKCLLHTRYPYMIAWNFSEKNIHYNFFPDFLRNKMTF